MQRVCLDRQRLRLSFRSEDPWFDSSYRQTQRISKAANFDKFFDSNPFTLHTFINNLNCHSLANKNAFSILITFSQYGESNVFA
jgi:hypothetical protein